MSHGRAASVLAAITLVATLGLAPAARGAESNSRTWCGTDRDSARASIWAHREQVSRHPRPVQVQAREDVEIGDITVLMDGGDLALLQNRFDLHSVGLVFEPAGDGFRASRVDSAVAPDAGTILQLGDDDTREVALPFSFSFYGTTYQAVFVNSDGNLTFTRGDIASTSRSLGRMAAGPPRIAPLFADFDPSVGGSVRTLSEDARFTVTWTGVPRYGERDSNTFRVTLRADGGFELAYAQALAESVEAVTGVAPGEGRGELVGVDFSETGAASGILLAESFREQDQLDSIATARRFYAGRNDDYDQLVVFTTQTLTEPRTIAYQQTVQNQISGIGDGSYDYSAEHGSAGRLESFVMMDDLAKYPADPHAIAFSPDSTLSILAHETGHRWLAQVLFRSAERNSDALLGRADVHWSFFMNSLGSYLEGNEIEDVGAGRFQTIAASTRYSPLDQYLMGIRSPGEVPDFFYVDEISGTPLTDEDQNPRAGVTFSGVRHDVSVDDVIAAEGARNPAPQPPASPWRQAFILVSIGGPPATHDVDQVERILRAWPAFFARSTSDRWSVETKR
jgi:hypothetical protein